MSNYIDGFAFPISKSHLDEYKAVALNVAQIWKEHGALAYCEFLGNNLTLEGTRSFVDSLNINDDETVIFGWVLFESLQSRDRANKMVAGDPRMPALIEPLMNPSRKIFDPERMAFGGFESFIAS